MTEPKLQYPNWMLDENGNPDAEIAKEFEAERDVLIEQIEVAFANVPMPRHDKVAIKYDSYSAFFGNMDGVNRDLGGKLWQDIPFDTLIRYSYQFGVFTLQGFHYYLPAMLIAVVNYFYDTEILPEILADIFSGKSITHPFRKNKHRFSVQQAQALIAYFNFLEKWWYADEADLSMRKSIEFWQSELKRLGGK